MDSYKESGVVDQYEILATLDGITSDVCREMDGKVFKLSEQEVGVTYPPFHVNCRTTTVPYFDDEDDVGERIARDEDGQAYYVPGDMTYEQWKKDHVLGEYRTGGNIEGYNKGIIDGPGYREKFEGLGLSNKATNSVARETRRAIKVNDLTPNERAVFINQTSGTVLERTRGYPYGVTFDESILDDLKEGSVILTHNHPLGTTFSSDDINTLMRLPQISTIVAGGHNGKVYSLSIGKGKRLDGSISKEYNRLRRIFEDDLQKVVSELSKANKWEYEVR